MSEVFDHSVILGLGFFLCFFYALYSDKIRVFDQSERAPGPIYTTSNSFH